MFLLLHNMSLSVASGVDATEWKRANGTIRTLTDGAFKLFMQANNAIAV